MSTPGAALRVAARIPIKATSGCFAPHASHIARRQLSSSRCIAQPLGVLARSSQVNGLRTQPARSIAAWQSSGRRWHSAPSEPTSKAYDFNGVKQMIEDTSLERVLVDVREPSEYNEGFIPTAINIPVKSHPDAWFLEPDEFEDRFGFTKPSPTKELVFYCKAGVRSSAAAALAKQGGYDNVGEYRGSWIDWEEHGGPNSKQTRGENVEDMNATKGQTARGNEHGV